MNSWSRREFLYGLGALSAFSFKNVEPDMVIFNGNILTQDTDMPRAQAACIAGGRFYAVGTDEEMKGLAGFAATKVDLERKTVVPGFIDAHTHPAVAGRLRLHYVDCGLKSIDAIVQALRERAAKTPPGQWVLGFMYDDTKTLEKRPITRKDLDLGVSEHPVYIIHRGFHSAFFNSVAMKLSGVNDMTPDPQGGQFVRDKGKLTGLARERAKEKFESVIPIKFTREDYRDGVELQTKLMAKSGITSVHEASASPEELQGYFDAYEAGKLSTRVYCHINHKYIDQMIAAGVHTGFGNEWVRVGAMKLIADGSISERTARLSQPYIGQPDYFGILVTEEPELREQATKGHRAGWQLGTHANGDVAIDMTLRIYERLQREYPRRDPRFRLEHCSVVNPSLIGRIRDLNAIPTPFSTYVYYNGEKMHFYGAERLNWMFAARSFLDAGIHVTQASDYPPGPFEPMMAIQSQVTRTDSEGNTWGPQQRITVEEALRVGTVNGAYASFEENLKGSITGGKLADLVVLGKDPTATDPFAIVNIPIERTMVGGRWKFES